MNDVVCPSCEAREKIEIPLGENALSAVCPKCGMHTLSASDGADQPPAENTASDLREYL